MSDDCANIVGVRIGSLFSGYGGLDLAVQSVLGGDIAWHADNDPSVCRILRHHFPGVPNHGDLTRLDFRTVEPVDVLAAGYPCQPFSAAGLRRGTDDDRHLWPYVLDAIRIIRPRLLVLENVRGHLNLGFPEVIADLAGLGWSVRWGLVRASDAGAPHRRARLFAVAYPERERWDGSGAPRSAQVAQGGGADAQRFADASQWREYGTAIRRWEAITGRPAPAPTRTGGDGVERLSEHFAEWLMGLPAGWVTGSLNDDNLFGIGHRLSRQEALRIIGNGVVPQQAALALDVLLQRTPNDIGQSFATV